MAVTLRGDRGSQPGSAPRRRSGRRLWRSPFGATEDRNMTVTAACIADGYGGHPSGRPRIATTGPCSTCWSTRSWRSPFGATEDRNFSAPVGPDGWPGWRSPFGATEDRNIRGGSEYDEDVNMADTLRGDRGSQLDHRGPARPRRAMAVTLRGDRGSHLLHGPWDALGGTDGGHPSGRPRIATTRGLVSASHIRHGGHPSGRPRIATLRPTPRSSLHVRWRSPFGATEDRNYTWLGLGAPDVPWRSPFGATEDRNVSALAITCIVGIMAVTLRGDRGSQHRFGLVGKARLAMAVT